MTVPSRRCDPGKVPAPMFDLPSPNAPGGQIPRQIPEGTVPLLAIEGAAYNCGREYGELIQEQFPFYASYHHQNPWWLELPPEVKRLYERQAPHLFDLFQGLSDGIGQLQDERRPDTVNLGTEGCTSFGVSGKLTLDGEPFSGQTKDTHIKSAHRYVVLRMRIKDAPTILTLAYPGEILGYGMWSTGMSIFRNSLYSSAGAKTGLSMDSWGYLMLAGSSVHDGVDLAKRFGLAGTGNCLISDPQGESLSVEFNAGGVSTVPANAGIATHGNHAEGDSTLAFANYAGKEGPSEEENSQYRMHGFRHLLHLERGRLTPQRAFVALADHTYYPQGTCRHWVEGQPGMETTAAVVVEPTKGLLHAVRGQPCANWPVTYSL